jgi:two-component system sensor histidine kinase SenX3
VWIAAVAALVVGMLGGLALGVLVRRRTPAEPLGAAEAADGAKRRAGAATDRGQLCALVIEKLTAGVAIVDRDEFVLLANPAARSMRVVDGDRLSVDALRELTRRVLATGADGDAELELPRAGREPQSVFVRALPLRVGGPAERVSAVALVVLDVTDERRLDAVRRDFVANVSHELKTPVGALTLLAEAVQDAAADPEAVTRFAGRMQTEGARLGRLINELIALSRLEGADRRPAAVPVPVTRLVNEAVGVTATAAEQAGIMVQASGGEQLTVPGNETQLVSALANLIDNAIRYSPANTRVAIAVRESGSAEAPTVEIAVTDQGIGISPADLPRVFERFFRVDDARSRATGGTGLGLAIVKHTVTNHGGSVTAWSVPGSGSTFTLTLPAVPVPSVSSAPDPAGEVAGPAVGRSVLTRGSR